MWEERSGKGRRVFLLNMFAYNYVSHRGSDNKLLYHLLKGKVTGLCGTEPSRTTAGQILSFSGLRALGRAVGCAVL